ncbi:hypothetical protein EXW72_10020 [Pseudomonas sp. BCA14]|uniref:hypothetical protein n=1 Tax=unclassified Pseudomonas TaxID=196821 RepID=UPI00106DDAFE|nr:MULTISPECIES: hypothetical protein [unclassified Pseudomonas]NCE83552.1 hypothetical protein [Pseudomonas sp. Q1]TFF09657.1 hypothetical protein EXW70_11520 [Pseudomonas sp. JMN1]TFF11799.1 hypothetical protein EXW71_09270 [Pseudomonas sp. BCA17]TFF28575.1 hypothetical protein EXW72_10020 [Pseudomonas sp. BCA14]
MNIDEDTCEWLGLPTPLEMYKQHCLILENEIKELNLQLRKARADVFCISQTLLDVQAKNAEFAGYLRERGAEAAAMRKEIAELTTSKNFDRRELAELRQRVGRPTVKLS